MSKHLYTLFVVTGINRMTREREAISIPAKWPMAWKLFMQ